MAARGSHSVRTEHPRRALYLGLATALALLLLVWGVFLRGGDESGSTPAPAIPMTEAPEVEEEVVSPPKRSGPVETFEVFAPKDPFDPLISAAPSGAGAGEVAPAGGAATTTTTGPDGTTTTTTTTSGSRSDDEYAAGHRVSLIDVFGGQDAARAQVQVDTSVYTVDVGERFARNFELLSATGDCATMLYGDDQFTICEGEEILK